MSKFTLDITDKEKAYLEKVSEEKGISMARVLIQGLRLYQTVEARLKAGERIFVENDKQQRTHLEFIL